MNFFAKYVLITFLVCGAASEVQEQNNKYFWRYKGRRVKRQTENVVTNNNEFGRTSNAVLPQITKENKLTYTTSNGNMDDFNIYPAKNNQWPIKHFSRTAKENSLNTAAVQRIYCRQIAKTEINKVGNIIDSIQQVCDSLPTTTASSTTTLPPFKRERQLSDWFATTPKGINCRCIMNSELNDVGEIVDSVIEVCDPPTTTTTTTRKPIFYTRPTTASTTTKTLVKVCRPVMNSYLNEEGRIIDSVDIYCKMETVN